MKAPGVHGAGWPRNPRGVCPHLADGVHAVADPSQRDFLFAAENSLPHTRAVRDAVRRYDRVFFASGVDFEACVRYSRAEAASRRVACF